MAHFKTAYMQKEVVLDAIVKTECKVGDLVSYDTETKQMNKVTKISEADYIIAQSDMTMEYGHVPVENRDWKYSDKVAVSSVAKKVAAFFIIDESDIIPDVAAGESY